MQETNKKRPFAIDKDKRQIRRSGRKEIKKTYARKSKDEGGEIKQERVIETSIERAESLSVMREMAQSFASTIEFYKADYGGRETAR